MTYISPKGSISAPIYVVVEKPYDQDKDKGYIYSAGYGYVFDRMLQDAGIKDAYICCLRPDLGDFNACSIVENQINQFKPPIIIPLGNALGYFCPETKKRAAKGKTQAEQDADLEKYAGSILSSDKLNYPHYIIPSLTPDHIVRNWDLRDITVNLDLGKAVSELEYFRKHGTLEPLPQYVLRHDFDEPGKFGELLEYLERYEQAKLLSVDIETIYPNKKSLYWPHPGYPVTIGMADSSTEGISFRLFRSSKQETATLWRYLSKLLPHVPILGQNFFDFDAPRLDNLGFSIDYNNITDTLIRHHILWPELPHKLQFQTKQYTRQPYYKDEGHGWHIKDLKKLMHYNCLDVCVTYKVWEEQEKEFAERSHLK